MLKQKKPHIQLAILSFHDIFTWNITGVLKVCNQIDVRYSEICGGVEYLQFVLAVVVHCPTAKIDTIFLGHESILALEEDIRCLLQQENVT